jgi:hypothetical protein
MFLRSNFAGLTLTSDASDMMAMLAEGQGGQYGRLQETSWVHVVSSEVM